MENNAVIEPVGTTDATTTPAVEPKEKTRGKFATKDMSTWPNVVFTWSDGAQSTVDVTAFPDATRQAAEMYGWLQKLGDSYALGKGQKGAPDPTLDDAKAAFQAQLDAIIKDGWKAQKAATSTAPVEEPAEQLAQAIVLSLQEQGKAPDMDKILAQVKAADRKTRNLWRNDPDGRVAFHLARLKNAGAQSGLAGAFGY